MATSCSKDKDKLIISGSNKITTFVHYNGEEDYQCIDVKQAEPIDATWNLDGNDKQYFNIDNNGALVWTNSALSDIRDYNITLVCTTNNMTAKKNVVVSNLNDPLPTATHITIYGSSEVTGEVGVEGHSDFTCTDNNGHRIVGAQWSIVNAHPNWLTINNNGLLHWTNSCIETPTTTLELSCNRQGLTSATFDVDFTINTTPTPDPTSISIYGSTNLTGVSGSAGASDYVAIDSNGHKISDGQWNIIDKSGCDGVSVNSGGQVNWTSNATSGTFKLSCELQSESLIGISEIITLTINDGPTPPKYTSNFIYNNKIYSWNSKISISIHCVPSYSGERNDKYQILDSDGNINFINLNVTQGGCSISFALNGNMTTEVYTSYPYEQWNCVMNFNNSQYSDRGSIEFHVITYV